MRGPSRRRAVTRSGERRGPEPDSHPAGRSRLSRSGRTLLDEQIAAFVALCDGLDSCIGCGCLSLPRCRRHHTDARMGEHGTGARLLPPTLLRKPRRRGCRSGTVVRRTPTVIGVAAPIDRWLALEGIDNVRDVGGLPLRDGGTTRSGALLRSASLHHVTPADVDHLVEVLGLRLVLDLRTGREIDRDGPTAVAGAGVPTVALSFIPEEGRELPETDDDTDPLLRTYLGYLQDAAENVVEGVRRLAAEDGGPTLVHCAAGKDRTGVFVALVLDAVGVERDAVVADYALSAEQVEAMFRRWTTAAGAPMPDDLTPHLPRAEVMAAVLAHLDAEYAEDAEDGAGGAAGWLRAHGLDDAALDRLKGRLRP